MKTTLLAVSALIVASCSKSDLKIEVYTPKNIHYFDFEKLRATNEVNDSIKTFKSVEEMKTYISEVTAKESNI